MRCVNCGREIKDGLDYCPDCGMAVSISQTNADIQARLGVEVDRMMGTSDNLRNIHDGVEIIGGSMEVTDPSAAEEESIFAEKLGEEVTAESVQEELLQDFEELDLNEDYEDVPVINVIRETEEEKFEPEPEETDPEEKPVQAHSESYPQNNKKQKKGRGTDIFLVIIIIVMGLAAAGYIVFGILLNNEKEKKNPETQTTASQETTQAVVENDVISSNINNGEEYQPPFKITLSSKLGHRMYYTFDGTEPTTDSPMYNGSITLKERDMEGDSVDYTLKVYSFSVSGKITGRYSVSFSLEKAQIEIPVISPASGNYSSETEIKVSAEPGTDIYYTYGSGADPDENSALYTGPVKMKRGSNVFKAIAVKEGRKSEIASAVFNLSIPARYNYDQALELLRKKLIDQERMNDKYITPIEGKIFIGGNGKTVIDETSFYCFAVTETDKDGKEISAEYFGVDDSTGKISVLRKLDNGTFVLAE